MVGEAHIAEAQAAAAPRPRIRDAPRVLVLAATIGVLGQLLFVGVGLGLNMPLAVIAVLAAALADRRDVDAGRHWQDWSLSRLVASSALERIEGR
jgi:hypothetical protein